MRHVTCRSTNQPNSLRIVEFPGRRLRRCASWLLQRHPLQGSQSSICQKPDNPVRIVCISDTHDNEPELPDTHILILAGESTENGSFEETQAQLTWLSRQQHPHKIITAENHDVLLDEDFLSSYTVRRYGNSKSQHNLSWPANLHHLNCSSVGLDVVVASQGNRDAQETLQLVGTGRIKIYSNPYTPQYGVSVFQYPRSDETFWEHNLPSDADFVVVDGPPRPNTDR